LTGNPAQSYDSGKMAASKYERKMQPTKQGFEAVIAIYNEKHGEFMRRVAFNSPFRRSPWGSFRGGGAGTQALARQADGRAYSAKNEYRFLR
jgi:hypothetical protein